MIDNCMRNTFGVITHRISIDEVLEMYKGKDAMFYGDPFNISTDELKDIDYRLRWQRTCFGMDNLKVQA